VSTFERTTLDNGLRVLTAPMPQAQSVSCFVMLAAGSRYETRETSGIAHFAEHMFFKGTERRPTARDIAAEVDAIGGEFNAFTSKEYTGYYVRCASEYRDTALDVLVDMLRNSKFDAEEIDREKGVIVEEMNMYFDTPRDYISGVYDALVYGDHPLGWDIVGRKETIQDVDRDTFLGYLDLWYKPSRMVVGVAGNFGDGLLDRIGELLGDVATGHTGSPAPAAETGNGARVKVHTKASEQAHLCLGVRGYPIEHPDRYAVEVLRVVLGGGMSSRLFTEVRERRGLAYYVYAVNQAYTDTGSLYTQAGVDVNRVDEAVKTIVDELSKIVAETVPPDELEKARSYAKGRFVLQLESPQGMNMYGLRREVLEGSVPDSSEVLAGLDAVTADDVQRVAADILHDDGFRLALIGPFEDADRFEALLGQAAARA
jgi:predicted Zn-dependent peptidase